MELHPCVSVIKNDINNLTKYRLAPLTADIKRDMKYALWHGFINEKIYNELYKLLEDKRDSLWE